MPVAHDFLDHAQSDTLQGVHQALRVAVQRMSHHVVDFHRPGAFFDGADRSTPRARLQELAMDPECAGSHVGCSYGIADLAQVRQKRGETVAEYIQRFRTIRNRCFSVHVSEKEAVELAVVGLSSSIKDVASQADYPSLAHMVQKLSAYEQRHPDVYQDKFKRAVVLVEVDEDEGVAGNQEVAVAEWTRAAGPVSCKWVKPPGPPKGFDFDVTKTEQIFDLLLTEKQIKVPEGHKIPTVQELNGKPYCKWHNTFSHTTNDWGVAAADPNGDRKWTVNFQPGLDTTLVRMEMRAAALIAKTQRKLLHAIGSAKMASATSQREK
ncbi:hypothetical protein QYE76_046542 [Lolium multiflorum]|uniref:Retrotransposon gag domain-containing protein n=1 Tax=Lolium multiflorum TaxID=4521 RepID=A0AAD8TQ17_LOLMU|nr:hypothetical protein QYE76_046542 [Lolium multiflorum]